MDKSISMNRLEILENYPKNNLKKHVLLFLHGMWHGAWCWEPYFLPYFEELGYKAYAMSLSNHAGSRKRKSFNALRISDYVDDLKEVVDSLKEPPVLIGHSMGGFIVQKYLEKYEVPGAVLMTPVPPFGIMAGTLSVLKKFPGAFLKANLTLNLKHIIDSPEKYRYILGSDHLQEQDIREYLKLTDTESYLAYMDMLFLDLVKTDEITTPLLLLGGGKDHAVPLKAFIKTCKTYKTKPVIFEDMGHLLMVEPEYKKVAQSITDWIENL
jgi:alpha-beta hydrolase superfamily lysophospholipase